MVGAVVDFGMSKAAAARQFNTTLKTVGKWIERFRADGVEGLRDRSSRPLSSPGQIPVATCDAAESLRRQRCTQEQIAVQLRISKASVSRILKRRGLSLLSALEPQMARPRYERASPGEIIHIDIKKLGRFHRTGHRITREVVGHSATGRPGWEFVHVAIDDHSRLAMARIFPDERKESAVAFLEAAVAWYRSLGITVSRVMTDNGSCYRARAFLRACARLNIKPIRTRPYTPQTNGKAERFIQTSIREWAYARPFQSSAERSDAMPAWLRHYNSKRPHSALNGKPPISRIVTDNVLGNDT
jgi:transposase InsO family protein